MLTFEQFQTNVQEWSEARGIYEHSTALAQALKAVSEVGELADATIKNDRDELRDAIGDVAVCLVNVAYMTESQLDYDYIFDDVNTTRRNALQLAAGCAGSVGELSFEIARDNRIVINLYLDAAICSLYATAKINNLDFLDCCEAAWNEIKDRKGHTGRGTGGFGSTGDA